LGVSGRPNALAVEPGALFGELIGNGQISGPSDLNAAH